MISFLILTIFLRSTLRKKSVSFTRGCPFVLFKMGMVNEYLDLLDKVFERIHGLRGNINVTCPELSGERLYSNIPFKYNEKKLLVSEYFIIPK
jgi:hypothetical protein